VVAKVRERLSVSKRTAPNFNVERFNLKRLNYIEVREEYQVEISHGFLATFSRLALGPNNPPIQWVLGVPSLGIKRLKREADHLPPSSAENKNVWIYSFTLPHIFIAWYLVTYRIYLHGVVLG
jgi:hypothetical protein